ncbi:MAG: N-acetylmuramoyl-L-alanine amidase [Ghiorsea sp.]|nr:N-acetylmuramoyl-L-alanine amidase [Ghiorsea sp.]
MIWVQPAQAATSIHDIRLWTAPDHTRLVLDLSQAVEYNLFRLHNPERIVIDLKKTRMKTDVSKLNLPDPVLLSIRHGKQKGGVTRLVLDVKKGVSPRSFLLKKTKDNPHRLVIDLTPKNKKNIKPFKSNKQVKHGDIIIAVDAGHGGEDPGAIGPNKVYEKTVTLAIAKALAKLIDEQPGMKAVLVRTGDYFVKLRDRVKKVRAEGASMMISIHADAVTQRHVKGASVYTLSESGATPDRVAAALAAKENASDLVGGVMPKEEVSDPFIRNILGDMAKRDGLDSSEMFANLILKQLKHDFPIKYAKPKHARFAVLTALEIPSVLVEVDYISNPERERLLKRKSHQKGIAKAIFTSTKTYFTRLGMLDTSVPQIHTVHRGESLWGIAKKYGVSMSSILKLNNLKQQALRIGQRLRLPQS